MRGVACRVPKELIARFVKSCPTCAARRNPVGYNLSGQSTPGATSAVAQRLLQVLRTPPVAYTPTQPVIASPPQSRRQSRKDGKHALEATSDCGAYTTECDTYASRHARKSSFVYPVSMEQHLGNIASSQTAQQFTYAMLSAPPSQLRSFAQVSEHGLGTTLPPAFFSIKPTPNGS
jgi:hypothetical protein